MDHWVKPGDDPVEGFFLMKPRPWETHPSDLPRLKKVPSSLWHGPPVRVGQTRREHPTFEAFPYSVAVASARKTEENSSRKRASFGSI